MQVDSPPLEFFHTDYRPETMLADLMLVFDLPEDRATKLTQMAIDCERRLPPPKTKPGVWRYRSRCFTRYGNPSDLAYRAEESGSSAREIYWILRRAILSDWLLNWEVDQASNLHGDTENVPENR